LKQETRFVELVICVFRDLGSGQGVRPQRRVISKLWKCRELVGLRFRWSKIALFHVLLLCQGPTGRQLGSLSGVVLGSGVRARALVAKAFAGCWSS